MKAALSAFLSRIEAIEGIIRLRDGLILLGRVTPSRAAGLEPAGSLVRSSVRKLGQAGMQPILDGSVLLVTAAFEQFVSDVMIAYADDLPSVVSAYRNLPNAIRSANERYTGEALQRTRNRFSDYQLHSFTKNLADCHQGVEPYVLNGEAIVLNERNLKANVLKDLINRLGVTDIWREVARTRVLQRWSGPGGARAAESRAKNQLNELIDDRNLIAHRVGTPVLGPDTIRSYTKFVCAMAKSMVKSLEDHSSHL